VTITNQDETQVALQPPWQETN